MSEYNNKQLLDIFMNIATKSPQQVELRIPLPYLNNSAVAAIQQLEDYTKESIPVADRSKPFELKLRKGDNHLLITMDTLVVMVNHFALHSQDALSPELRHAFAAIVDAVKRNPDRVAIQMPIAEFSTTENAHIIGGIKDILERDGMGRREITLSRRPNALTGKSEALYANTNLQDFQTLQTRRAYKFGDEEARRSNSGAVAVSKITTFDCENFVNGQALIGARRLMQELSSRLGVSFEDDGPDKGAPGGAARRVA
jgi:hypothetical protein